MKLSIPQASLIEALKKARLVLGRAQGGTVAVFSCVLLEAEGDRLSLVTTNGDMRLSLDLKADVTTPGAILLPCERLISVVSPMRGDVSIDANNKLIVSLSGGPVNAKLHGLDAKDFLSDQSDEGARVEFAVASEILAEWLSRVGVAMYSARDRAMLQGIHLRDKKGFLCLEAADGRRVHLIESRTEVEAVDAIIPAPAVNALEGLLGKGDATVSVTENRLTVTTAGMVFRTQLLNFEYPSLKAFFPDPNPEHVEIIIDAAMGALDSALAIQSRETPSVHVLAGTTEVVFRSEVSEVGTVDANAECRAPSPRDFRVRPEYLRDALKALRTPTAKIEVNPGRLPIAIREAGFTAVVGCMFPPQPQTENA